jgi:hypothetical protein
MFSLIVDLRYFMRELLPLGAMTKEQLPVYLTSWVDKTSPLCMYTLTHTRAWSNAHLKAGCWYIDCGKVFCPLEEEDVKKACGQADSKDAATVTNQGDELEDEVEEDINLLPEKEKTKAAAKKKKAEDKAVKTKEKEKKDGKKGDKSGKKASTPPLLLTEASAATPSQIPRKRDASAAELSMSRLQQVASPALRDYTGGVLCYPELIMCTSLLSIDAHYVEHEAFPKEWTDLKAFIEKVILISC